MSGGDATLEITGLCAGYRHRPVIRDLSLAGIAPGTVTALVGPNAAGKSTLLRAIAGLIPASGSAHFGGSDLLRLDLGERARHVAFVPQLLPANASLTVLESVIAAQRASPVEGPRISARDAQERAMEALDRFEIADLALEPLDRLSGGQRQLASLAQAVVRAPRLLLLDEPTSALDLRHQFHVMDIVRAIAREGVVVVVVLHDLNLAAQFAGRIVVLGRGVVRADGPPETAMTARMLADVYGVVARVEQDSHARLQIAIDGLVPAGGAFSRGTS
jgi:iron complex transport system ATP-binding protein